MKKLDTSLKAKIALLALCVYFAFIVDRLPPSLALLSLAVICYLAFHKGTNLPTPRRRKQRK